MADDSFQSQYPDNKLGNVMRLTAGRVSEYYREYVVEDYGHHHLVEVSESVAKEMIEKSPYYPFVLPNRPGSFLFKLTKNGGLENKAALRLTPPPFSDDEYLTSVLTPDEVNNYSDRSYHFQDARIQLWIYRHDRKYWLTCAPGVCFNLHHR